MSRKVYEKVCNGDHISDEELKQAIKDYNDAEAALLKLGPYFAVARKAITTTLDTLERFQNARKDK